MHNRKKAAEMNESDSRRLDTKKAMAFDLICTIESDQPKKTYTSQEIIDIIRAYIRKESEEQ